MYFLAQSGAVFEDPIKADPNWPRVLVIDPESHEQAEAFARAYIGRQGTSRAPWDDRTQLSRDQVIAGVQAAFRAMLVEPPVKPAEPNGLGAVVEDAKGRRWVRKSHDDLIDHWTCQVGNAFTTDTWERVTAVRVLSEGVAS